MYTSAHPYPICPLSSYATDPARISALDASQDNVRWTLPQPSASIAVWATRCCRPTSGGSLGIDYRVKGERYGR